MSQLAHMIPVQTIPHFNDVETVAHTMTQEDEMKYLHNDKITWNNCVESPTNFRTHRVLMMFKAKVVNIWRRLIASLVNRFCH